MSLMLLLKSSNVITNVEVIILFLHLLACPVTYAFIFVVFCMVFAWVAGHHSCYPAYILLRSRSKGKVFFFSSATVVNSVIDSVQVC